MDMFLILGMIGFGMLIVVFILYSMTTNKIIRDQEKDLERLSAQVHRLNAKIHWLETGHKR